jgi:hypothetical protein
VADNARLAALLKAYPSEQTLAPYGMRHGNEQSVNNPFMAKGKGYFGQLPAQDGMATELSSIFEHNGQQVEHPLIVPTLTKQELQHLTAGNEPTPEIYSKAEQFAIGRIKQGKSPFAGQDELRYPVPKD